MINAGELDKQIMIQFQAKTRDTYGAEIVTWTDLYSTPVWANIKPLRGKEYFDARQIQAEANHKIKMRYRTGLNTSMRFQYGNRYFYILEMQNVNERGEELLFLCKEVV